MFDLKRSANTISVKERGFTLVELMVAQSIGLIVLTGVFALMTSFMTLLKKNEHSTEAQVNLRESLHVVLRELQALGGEEGRAGELLRVEDGGNNAPDSFSLFKVNPGLCGGGITSEINPNSTLSFLNGGVCPFTANNPLCENSYFENKSILISGSQSTMIFKVDSMDAGACTLTLDTASQVTIDSLENLRATTGLNIASVDDAINFLASASTRVTVRVGDFLSYRVANNALERKSDDDTDYYTVVENVYDMQIRRAYDLDDDGRITQTEWVGNASAVQESDLAGANSRSYFGAEVMIITFSNNSKVENELPQNSTFNRQYQLTSTEKKRDFRFAKMSMYARNRN